MLNKDYYQILSMLETIEKIFYRGALVLPLVCNEGDIASRL